MCSEVSVNSAGEVSVCVCVCACVGDRAPMMPEDKMLLAAAIICAASYLRDQSTTDRVSICCLRVCVSTCATMWLLVTDVSCCVGRGSCTW